ncbi:LCP family protein [Virgisporangium ochraceum]|uniref:Transcriptional regulator n=2 Tax=Virgisporangium ochraceum TaxID=65505 RepID=A0A8J3ZQI5_9ACTN|nr:transcriptional regulator [Virgisporangium ochraceum]
MSVGPPGKTPEKKSTKVKDPLWARLMIFFGIVLVLASGSLIGAGKVLANRYDNSVKRDTLIAEGARADVPQRNNTTRIVGPLNYLLLGSDLRPGDDTTQRTDTMIVAHVPATLDRVYLISIPRDLRVHIPEFPDTEFAGSYEKINGAYEHGGYGAGGVQLLSATIADLIGIRFDGAAIVDFQGFQDVVKELGGVEMCVEQRVVSAHLARLPNGELVNPREGGEPIVYEPGCREFNHWQALDYVRQRYSLPDGDYGRMRHQQQFLQALLRKARAEGLTSNPLQLDRLIRAVAGTLTVDTGGTSLETLMFGLRDIRPADIIGLDVPSEPVMVGGIAYIYPLEPATSMFEALVNDTLDDWVAANPTWVNTL